MAFWKLLRRKNPDPGTQQMNRDRGILVFENTSEVIRAENLLKKSQWDIRMCGPPPGIRSGCDLVIEIPLIEELNILRILESAENVPLEVIPIDSPLLKPVDLFHIRDCGRYLMVRAAKEVGELAFLADEEAPHPFYTRGFILHENNQVPSLIERAYAHKNAAKSLLVKGQPDYVVDLKGIQDTLEQPTQKAMEAIGGTGDTLTGIVSALIAAGMAARVNRLAGHYAKPTPATQIMDIIRHIPAALTQVLDQEAEPRESINV